MLHTYYEINKLFLFDFHIIWNRCMYFFAIYLPNIGPARIIDGIPAIKPNKITQPRSAPIKSATAMGPGVGGIKLCVTAKPANSGIP